MTFQLAKPGLVAPRGQSLIKPVESLNMAMNLITRTVGDPQQSAVRVGELVDIGIVQTNPEGQLIPGRLLADIEARLQALEP